MFQEAYGSGKVVIDENEPNNTNASILIYKREKFFYD